LREPGAGRLVEAVESDAFEDQRIRRGTDYCQVEKILADVDSYKCSAEGSG